MKKRTPLTYILIFTVFFGSYFIFGGLVENVKKNTAEKTYVLTEAYYSDFEIYTKANISKYRSGTGYRLIYEYKVNGDTYYVKINHSSDSLPEKGSVLSVYYDPEDPQKNFLPSEASSAEDIKLGAFIILISAVVVLFIFFKNGVKRRLDSVYRSY